MDTRTGEIRTFADSKERDSFVSDKRKKGEPWWVECKVEPTKEQAMTGLKGWHWCLCGSGKKFHDCCRKLYVFKHGKWVNNPALTLPDAQKKGLDDIKKENL